MWELIVHHTYKWHGIATDLSFYDSHGVAEGLSPADFQSDGATTGSGAWQFHFNSRVVIPANSGWKPLVGVRVECTARLTSNPGHRNTLIDAHGAFKVYASDRYLFGSFRGDPAVYPDSDWDIVGTYKDGTQFPGYRLTVNKWVQIIFEHDGLTQMRLLVDGEAVTWPRGVLSGIPGVGPKGICIGNAVVGGDQPFPGQIDEVKVWRLDPKRAKRQFLERPLDEATADCWARYVTSLRAAYARYPDCAIKVRTEMRAILDRFLRAVVTRGPESRAYFGGLRARYAVLWREGKIDGLEMAKLIGEWCAWLRLAGIEPAGDERARALRDSECWRLIQKELAGVDCDPQVLALIQLFDAECGLAPVSSSLPPEQKPPRVTSD